MPLFRCGRASRLGGSAVERILRSDPKGREHATPQGPREEGPPTGVAQEAQGGGGCVQEPSWGLHGKDR